MEQYDDIISVIQNSSVMQQRWIDYQKDFDYADDIKFEDVCESIRKILDVLQ